MPIITETLYGSRAAENVPLYNLQDEFQFMSSDGKTGLFSSARRSCPAACCASVGQEAVKQTR